MFENAAAPMFAIYIPSNILGILFRVWGIGFAAVFAGRIISHVIFRCRVMAVSYPVHDTEVQALCWFNPLMWIATRKASDDLELSCDEIVLENMDEGMRRQYAELLLDTAGQAGGFTICLSAAAETMRYRLADSDHFEAIQTWDEEGLFSYLTSLEAERLSSPNLYPDIGGQELHLSINHDGLWYVTIYDRMIEVCWCGDGVRKEYFYLRSDVDWGLIEGYLN